MEAERKEALAGASGSAVSAWLKHQLWLHEAWAKHGPSCTGFWAKDPEKQRRDLEEVRDWLRGMVAQSPNASPSATEAGQ
jgi:hypothetical protein